MDAMEYHHRAEESEFRSQLRNWGRIQAMAILEIALKLGGPELMNDLDDELQEEFKNRILASPIPVSRLLELDQNASQMVEDCMDAWLDLRDELRLATGTDD